MTLGAVRHQFKPRRGGPTLVLDAVDGWEGIEVAPGGYDSSSGSIAAAHVEANPEVFIFGSEWRCIDDRSQVVWAGRLLDPSTHGGRSMLVGRGWGNLTKKTSRRYTPQLRDYSAWQPMSGEPFGANGHGYAVAPSVTVEVAENSIHASIGGAGTTDTSSNTVSKGSGNGVLLWLPTQNITRVAGTLVHDRFATPGGFEMVVVSANGPDGVLNDVSGSSINLSNASSTETDFDVTIHADVDMVGLVFRNSDPNNLTSTQHTARWHVVNLRANTIGHDDDYFASQLVRDIFGFLNINETQVQPNSVNTLPYDLADNSVLADALDYANGLTGWRHVIHDRNGARYAQWGPWGPMFDVPETVDLSGLVPLDRYTAIRIPFRHPGGSDDEVEVRADPDPFPEEPIYFDGPILDKAPNRENARAMGVAIMAEVSRERKGGSITFAELQVPDTDDRVSGHEAFAGCSLRLLGMGNLVLNVSDLRRTAEGVTAGFDSHFASVDRLVARQNLRQKRR